MTIKDFKTIVLRDLGFLEDAINHYPDETILWKILPGTSNSAGNLVLHLIGNLRHFIGAVIGKSGYVRNREEEFNAKNVSKAELLNLISICKLEVTKSLDQMQPAELDQEFAVEVSSKKSLTGYVFLHLISHFNYHLGQINYHRRVLSTVKTES
jgi:hypothetical protein